MPGVRYTKERIDQRWELKQGDKESEGEWLSVKKVPTEVHLDLLDHGKIADPFLDLNELSVRWVGEQTWTYSTSFPTPLSYGSENVKTRLVLEGLDTFASVFINGQRVLQSDNAFISNAVALDGLLQPQKENNTVEIVFESARQRGLQLVKDHPEHRFIVHQTEISRAPVRKPQYHWGWDWGPILMTAGPWKPICLETYTSRIDDFVVRYQLSDDLKTAEVEVSARVEGLQLPHLDLQVTLDGQSIKTESLQSTDNDDSFYTTTFTISNPALWYPHGYGPQNLHTFSVSFSSDQPQHTKRIGFRKASLIQEPDPFGTSFYFRINNLDIFSGGSNWIPGDSFLSRITPSTYRDWMELAVEGNQSMIRVWGGGIYETDEFYDACDEFGLLVWQDFAFACANYPTYPAYLESIEEEARQNVRRLQHHPSLIIWAGNNEDYQLIERYNLTYNFTTDKDPASWLKTDFPARYIYEHLLPTIVAEESKGTIYHPSSPWGNGTSTVLKVDPTVGDIHQWNMWHGEMHPYQKLPEMGGRFVSEFGMEAYPHLETIESAITDQKQRYPGSLAMDFRNKAIGHERRMISYVAENFKIKYDLRGFTHLTQVMQADALAWAYKSWRRQWGTKGKRQCGGVLVWQFNDCWPTASWAVVDWNMVRKPAWYAIKRALEPVTVGVVRKFHNWTMREKDELWMRDTSHIDPTEAVRDVRFDVWVASSRLTSLRGEVVIEFVSVRTGREVHPRIRQEVVIEPNGTTEVLKDRNVEEPTGAAHDVNKPFDTAKMDPFIIHAALYVERKRIATDISWPDPIKYLDFSDRGVKVESFAKGSVCVTANKPVKGFVFSERKGVKISDNGFDVFPGEEKQVFVEGIDVDKLEWTYVGE